MLSLPSLFGHHSPFHVLDYHCLIFFLTGDKSTLFPLSSHALTLAAEFRIIKMISIDETRSNHMIDAGFEPVSQSKDILPILTDSTYF